MALEEKGHTCRVDYQEEWDNPPGVDGPDDVVLVLRGLVQYQPKAGPINLFWGISHPELYRVDELNEFDYSFVASASDQKTLSANGARRVETLLQCTNPRIFCPPKKDSKVPRSEVLYVGNTRRQYRHGGL